MNVNRGFTLIELIVTLVIMGIVGVSVSQFISGPLLQYMTAADNQLNTKGMAIAFYHWDKDVRHAAPHSIRVSKDGSRLELLHLSEMVRYRADDSDVALPVLNQRRFESVSGEIKIQLLGHMPQENYGFYKQGSSAGILVFNDDKILSGDVNQPAPNINAYSYLSDKQEQVISSGKIVETQMKAHVFYSDEMAWCPADGASDIKGCQSTSNSSAEDYITLFKSHAFLLHSPQHRMALVDTPILYEFDSKTGQLWKYWGYSPQASIPTGTALKQRASIKKALVYHQLSGCQFSKKSSRQWAMMVELKTRLKQQFSLFQWSSVRHDA